MTTRLQIEGEVILPCELGYADLAALPDQVEDVGALIPGRTGGGVRLRAVLRRAGIKDGATHVTVSSSDGKFHASVPLASVREAVLAYRLGNEPLPEKLGGPIRLLIPDVEPCAIGEVDACANVKFVATLRLTRGAGADTRPTSDAEHDELHREEEE
jgi:Oxidoreductase molybdopterin binding domain